MYFLIYTKARPTSYSIFLSKFLQLFLAFNFLGKYYNESPTTSIPLGY